MTFTHAISTNNYGPAKFIVSTSVANGTHTTIASAITAASSGDTIFIRPGTYTEDLTLKAGVTLAAFEADGIVPSVSIVGKATASTAGSFVISSVRMTTNSDFLLVVSGSDATLVYLVDCDLICTNNTGISFTTSNAGALINIENCVMDLQTTGIALWSSSSTGSMNIGETTCGNSGGSSTASNNSAGTVALYNSGLISSPVSCSSTGVLTMFGVIIDSSIQNATAITTAGNQTSSFYHSTISSGSASAVSVGTGTTLILGHCVVNSTNTNAITGAGSVSYGTTDFSGTSRVINTTTQSNLNSGSFTPVVAFGGASTGITYATQVGRYLRTGNTVSVSIDILTTSKGSSTGAMSITGLPFASKTTEVTAPFFFYTGGTAAALSTGFMFDLAIGGTSINLYSELAATSNISALEDTNCANATTIRINFSYFI